MTDLSNPEEDAADAPAAALKASAAEKAKLEDKLKSYIRRNKALAERVKELKTEIADGAATLEGWHRNMKELQQEQQQELLTAKAQRDSFKATANHYLDQLNEEKTFFVKVTIAKGRIVGAGFRE